MTTKTATTAKLDFELVFNRLPGMWLVLDTAFTVLAQNDQHARATLTMAKDIVGRNLFEIFPDNPDHSAADGLSMLRRSLLTVLKTREPDTLPLVRYDVKGTRGPFQIRWWRVTNTPVLGKDGFVRWIINQAEDVTDQLAAAGNTPA